MSGSARNTVLNVLPWAALAAMTVLFLIQLDATRPAQQESDTAGEDASSIAPITDRQRALDAEGDRLRDEIDQARGRIAELEQERDSERDRSERLEALRATEAARAQALEAALKKSGDK